jgi:hypothetical protein
MQLLDLHLGRPVHRGALSVFPVWNGVAVSRPSYVVHSSSMRVEERAGSPVVGQLAVRNGGTRPALVLAGELLEGGQQHRVAATSLVVEAGKSAALEVRCVEAGRWSGSSEHRRGGRRAPASVRAMHDQGSVWDSVGRYEQRYGSSATHSVLEVTEQAGERAAALVADLRPLPFQSGLLVGIAGHPLLLEVFDSPSTLATVWDAVLAAAAIDAVDAEPIPTPGRRARRFLDRVVAMPVQTGHGAVGRDVESTYARRSTLVWHGRLVHTVATNPRHELVAA